MVNLVDMIDQRELAVRRRKLRAERIRRQERREMRRGDIAFRVQFISFIILFGLFIVALLNALEKAMW